MRKRRAARKRRNRKCGTETVSKDNTQLEPGSSLRDEPEPQPADVSPAEPAPKTTRRWNSLGIVAKPNYSIKIPENLPSRPPKLSSRALKPVPPQIAYRSFVREDSGTSVPIPDPLATDSASAATSAVLSASPIPTDILDNPDSPYASDDPTLTDNPDDPASTYTPDDPTSPYGSDAPASPYASADPNNTTLTPSEPTSAPSMADPNTASTSADPTSTHDPADPTPSYTPSDPIPVADAAVSNSDMDDEPPLGVNHQKLDREIRRKATKAKLSVRNVKHIIKSIITNEQVRRGAG